MNIENISRVSIEETRDLVKDAMYAIDKVVNNEISINDEYSLSILQRNRDVAYHTCLILSRLNLIKHFTVSEIRSALESGVSFSENDYHQDLANGDDIKRSTKIQKNKSSCGKYMTYKWAISNIANKKNNITWEVSHNGRMWRAYLPRSTFEGKSSLSVACDPNTGEPSKRSLVGQLFKETA